VPLPAVPRRLRTILRSAVCPRAAETARQVARRARDRFEQACGTGPRAASRSSRARRAGSQPIGRIGRALARRASTLLVLLALAASAGALQAQNVISVPFTNGFVGTRGSSAGTSNNVLTFATLGIARTFFIQNSSTNQFEELQGNDISGTLRIVRTNGTTLDIPASANWRINTGSTTDLIGILPRPSSPITFTYSGGSIQITDGANTGGTSIGGYVAAYSGAVVADGGSINGNAAQVLASLNNYLATVVASRPAGPVTVAAQSTTSTTPTITGTATLAVGEQLSVVVDGAQYTTSSTPAVVRTGNNWSLTLTSPLALGTYTVAATVTDADGFTLSDATTDELVIAAPSGTVTIDGSLTANDRIYDGTTSATGATGGLTLVGVNGGHSVTIASVTLAFQSAAVGAGKTVSITAVTLGGANGGQYAVSLAGAPTTTASITPKPLTITGLSAVSRAYDGTTAATLTGTAAYAGLASGDSFTPGGTVTASFASAAIGNAKAVTVTGLTSPSANYTVTQPSGLTANVTARPLTIGGSFGVASRVYDGTTTATIGTNGLTLAGVVSGDTVTLGGTAAAFASAAVGTGKTVSLTGATLAGAHAGNYALTVAGAPTTTADITAKALTIGGSFTAASKTADGTTAATISANALTLVGVVGGDVVSLTGATATFADPAVGTNKPVTLTAASLGGAAATNYSLSLAGAPTTTANITASGGTVTIVGSFTANDRVYDGTTAATGTTSGLALAGVAGADQVTIASVTLAFQTPGAGAGKTVVVTAVTLGGANAAQYTVSLAGAPTATATITARPLTIAGVTAASRSYDGTTAASLTGTAAYAGLASGESFTPSGTVTATFASADVGAGKAVTVGGYTAPSANYQLSQPTGLTASIAARTLTIGGAFTAASKPYDGTTTATIGTNALTLVGVVTGDAVALGGSVAAFGSATIGAGKPVSIAAATLSGAAAGNYTLSLAGAPTTTADITPVGSVGGSVTLAGSFTANDRVYDGTTAATGATGGLTLVGISGADQVGIASVTLAFQTASVGRGKTVVITAVTLSGANAPQYTVALSGAPTATASISAKALSIAGSLAAADKVFDGTTVATIGGGDLRLIGVVGSDAVMLTGATAAFASPEVGTGRTVALTAATLTGAGAGNYTLTMVGAPTGSASIVAATPPSAPRNAEATAGDGSIAVTWASPEAAGCRAVGGYLVEYSADDGRSWVRVTLASPTATSAVIPGLVNNVAYRVRVAAANACGAGTFTTTLGPIVPNGPMRDDAGTPVTMAPGVAVSTTGGVRQPVTTEVLQDTIVRAAGDGFTLRLRASDQPGAPISIDSSRTLQLEHGGRAMADGTGFAAGTFVTIHLVTASGTASLLGTVAVTPDESFSAALPIPERLREGTYTLQVNGIGANARPRSVALGVEVVPPPPELVLAATPDQPSPAVGDTLVITLTVTNEGRGVATDVVIPRAFREPGLRLVRTTPVEGSYNAATQEWTIGRIDPGARARMLLTVVVLPPAASQAPTP
jgi:hypothetical protein